MIKKSLLDASSAIILLKTDLLDDLTDFFQVYVTRSVLLELTPKNYPGAETFLSAVANEVIRVAEAEDIFSRHSTPVDAIDYLDQGEFDTIKCFEAGGMDLIITDDGRAARYCKVNRLPFVNALLFPRLLYFAGRISREESFKKIEDIIDSGRYSSEIIEWARSCRKEALAFAIP